MANFNQSARPKTVPSQPSRPLVPSPYFFRYYSNPYNKYSLSAKSGRNPSDKFESKHSYFIITHIIRLLHLYGRILSRSEILLHKHGSTQHFSLQGILFTNINAITLLL